MDGYLHWTPSKLWEFEFNLLTYPICPSSDGGKEKKVEGHMDPVCPCWWGKVLWQTNCKSMLLFSGFWRIVEILKLNGFKEYLMTKYYFLKGEANQNVVGFQMTPITI